VGVGRQDGFRERAVCLGYSVDTGNLHRNHSLDKLVVAKDPELTRYL
jgi:hypothetical protein